MSWPLGHQMDYSCLPRIDLQLIGMRGCCKCMTYQCCNDGGEGSVLKGSKGGLEYRQDESRLRGRNVTTLNSTLRRSRLGLYLGEQDAKGGEDERKLKVGTEMQHGCLHW